jgi:L-2-hydroxyglutarate oxidase LhgO
MSEVNVTIVGGGIVGCAIAAVCGRLGLSTVLVEREAGLGRGTTSRNSEVSHGGMYYPTGSTKARCCVQGRRRLKEFCLGAGVGYQECGKLIVAVQDEEIPGLESLLELGLANGVEDLEILDSFQVSRLEAEVRAVAALWSPRTAVVDAEGAAKAFGQAAAEAGVQVMTSSVVDGLDRTNGHWEVSVLPAGTGRRQGWTHTSDFVVNAAGLHADQVAALAGVDVGVRGLELVKVKGNYFRINPRHQGRISHLVYPLPPADSSSLGVHLCLDLAGQLRLGPDTELVADGELSYQVDPGRAESFFQGAVRFLPWLEPEDLSPDMCGYRPRFSVEGFQDFVVVREDGPLAGLINLIGIDSPGLTSAPALAEDVGRLLTDRV